MGYDFKIMEQSGEPDANSSLSEDVQYQITKHVNAALREASDLLFDKHKEPLPISDILIALIAFPYQSASRISQDEEAAINFFDLLDAVAEKMSDKYRKEAALKFMKPPTEVRQ